MPNVRSVFGSNTVKARVGSQNAVRVLSNASSPPTTLIDLNDVNNTLRTEDGMLLVWDLPTQRFIMTSVVDSSSLTIGGIVYYTNTTDNILGDPDTGSVQIDGGVGINKNVTIGAALSVTSSAYFNTGFVVNPVDNTLGNPDTGAFQVDGGVGINKNLTVGGGFYVEGASEFIGSARLKNEILDVNGNPGISGYLLTSNGPDQPWEWRRITDVESGFLDAIFIRQDGVNVGTGSATTLDFYENFSLTQPSVGITSIRLADYINIVELNVSDVSTFNNDITLTGDLNITGLVAVTEGLYYDSDSYEPNAVAYFNPDGQLSATSTITTIDTSNYILTTYETAGIGTPVWATAIDGGEY